VSAEEIVPSVYAIPLGYVNAFAFATERGLCLVDSGLKGHEKKILKAVAGMGRSASDVGDILVTHHHADHVGALAAIKQSTSGIVYIHPIDAPIVAGERRRPPASRSSLLGRVLGPLVMRLPANNPPPAFADREVSDGDELPLGAGVTVIHTPGHTAGSVSFLLREHGGVLFAGDAAGHMFGRLGKPFGMFTEDMAQARESIRKLAGLEFDIACFGHGSVLKGKAHAEFRRYVERMAR
jgi:glyoxylase-like metal-dependent hydrolase (beta-lactamase superfamily II)